MLPRISRMEWINLKERSWESINLCTNCFFLLIKILKKNNKSHISCNDAHKILNFMWSSMSKSSVKSERKMLTHVIDYCNGIDDGIKEIETNLQLMHWCTNVLGRNACFTSGLASESKSLTLSILAVCIAIKKGLRHLEMLRSTITFA